MSTHARIGVDRLSPTDVMELVCDVTGTSMQVAAVLVLDTEAPLDAAAVREAMRDRITAVPRLRQRLLDVPFGCGRPVWIDDCTFDINNHVDSVACSSPGDEQALMGVIAETVARRLQPGRPLWSATLVTGLAQGRCALVVVFHHVLADGMGGLAVLGSLVDGKPAGAGGPDFPRRPPGSRDLLIDVLHSAGPALARLPAGLRRLRTAAAELGTSSNPRAPRCSLNRPIGTGRALAVARADLAAVHAAAQAQGGTVNDVVVTAVTGALRAVLTNRGEPVNQLVVSMPVSARRQASAGELGNQVGVIPVTVPTTGEPAQRLTAVARITRQRKSAAPGSSAALLGPVFRVLAKVGAFKWFIDRQHLINTFVSNLRGPGQRLTLFGVPVVDVIPVPMITGNITVAFAALSYAGALNITVIADPELCPDMSDIAQALQREFDVLTGTAVSGLVGPR